MKSVSRNQMQPSATEEMSCRRSRPGRRKETSLVSLICGKLREGGADDDFVKNLVFDLTALSEELRRCSSRKASLKLLRSTLESAIFQGKTEGSELENERDGEKQGETIKEEPLEFRDVSDCRSPGGTHSDAIQVKSTTSEQELTEDTRDALCSPLVQEEKILSGKSNDRLEAVTIERVFLEEVSPQAKKMGLGHSRTLFYGSQKGNRNRNLKNIELVREKNMCTIYTINSERRRYIGRFHADYLIVHENGFQVTLEPEVVTLDEHDGGKQGKVKIHKKLRRKKEPQTFKFTVPEDQQREYQIVFGKMRKSLGRIIFG